jgi:hypothetical protein
MGKIIIEFDSETEQEEIKNAIDGYKWKLAVWDIDQKLRSIHKYGQYNSRAATSEEQNFAYEFRDAIREILDDYNLKIE